MEQTVSLCVNPSARIVEFDFMRDTPFYLASIVNDRHQSVAILSDDPSKMPYPATSIAAIIREQFIGYQQSGKFRHQPRLDDFVPEASP